MHVLCNFFFCHYVFKNSSAAEASDSVYMRERVKRVYENIMKWNINHYQEMYVSLKIDYALPIECKMFSTFWLVWYINLTSYLPLLFTLVYPYIYIYIFPVFLWLLMSDALYILEMIKTVAFNEYMYFVFLITIVLVYVRTTSVYSPFPHTDAFWRICSRRSFKLYKVYICSSVCQ